MIRIAVLGDIGSGKSYVAKQFKYPVFNADLEVSKLYHNNRKCYLKLKKKLPNFIKDFPIKKNNILNAILANQNNLKKIVKIVHPEINLKMKIFLKKNKNKKIVILDIPLLLENKINKKGDVLVYVDADQKKIKKGLKERKNYNNEIYKRFKKIQLSVERKKRKSTFIVKNNFKPNSVKKSVKNILRKILLYA